MTSFQEHRMYLILAYTIIVTRRWHSDYATNGCVLTGCVVSLSLFIWWDLKIIYILRLYCTMSTYSHVLHNPALLY